MLDDLGVEPENIALRRLWRIVLSGFYISGGASRPVLVSALKLLATTLHRLSESACREFCTTFAQFSCSTAAMNWLTEVLEEESVHKYHAGFQMNSQTLIASTALPSTCSCIHCYLNF